MGAEYEGQEEQTEIRKFPPPQRSSPHGRRRGGFNREEEYIRQLKQAMEFLDLHLLPRRLKQVI